jgi:MraZ protein
VSLVLFTGHSDHTIDSKLRLAIPAKHRNQLDPQRDGQAWYCVPWPFGVLRIYTEKEFEALANREEASLTPDEDRVDLESQLFGFAERLETDAQGRITIPKLHLDLARLASTEVVIVGARNRLEVRDRAAWLAGQQERFAKLPSLVARIEAKRRTDA